MAINREPTSGDALTDPPAALPEATGTLPELALTGVELARRELERFRAITRDRGLLRTLLEHSPHGIMVADARARLVVQNRAAERIWGGSVTVDRLEHWAAYRAFHADGRPLAAGDWGVVRALCKGEAIETEELRIQRFDGTTGWLVVSAAPFHGPDGAIEGALAVFVDVSAMHEAASERAQLREELAAGARALEEAARRTATRDRYVRLLADAGYLLASDLDVDRTLRALAELVVPALGDFCVIDLLEPGGAIRRVASHHHTPARADLAREVAERYPIDRDAEVGVAAVLRTGRTEWHGSIDDAALAASARDAGHLELLRRLAHRSYATVALAARGRILGAVTVAFSETPRRHDAESVAFLEELARRAALSLDNATLYRAQVEAREEALELAHELRAREQEFRLLAETMPQLVWTARADGRIDYWNRRWADYTGLTAGETSEASGWLTALHADDRERVGAAWREAIATGTPFEAIGRLRRGRDGVYRWFIVRATSMGDRNGRIRHWCGTCTDIHDQKQAEAMAALVGEVGVAVTHASSLDGMLARACEAVVTHLDAAFARLWILDDAGATLELRASAGLYTHLDGGHARVPVGAFKIGRIAAERRPHLTNDVAHDREVSDRAWAEREGMVAFAGYPLVVDDRLVGVIALFARQPLAAETTRGLGAVADAIAVAIGRAAAEAELRRSELRYELATRATREAIWDWDLVTDRIEWTDAIQALTGVAPDEVVRVDGGWFERVHPDDRQRVLDGIHAALEGGARDWQGEYRLRRADRSYAHVLDRAHIARDGRGRPLRMVGAVQDVSLERHHAAERERLVVELAVERARLQAKTAQLERSNLELDQFAYVTSHDLKAPLRGIASLAEWIAEDLTEVSPQVTEHLDLLRGRVGRMEALINGILAYARAGRSKGEPERLALDAMVHDVVDLLAPPPATTIEVIGELPAVVTDKIPLHQVLLNLIGNALKHAARDGGHVRIAAQVRGEQVQVSITDDGPGIDPIYHERIWGIFQTLESRDKVEATGIGLAVVKKLVEGKGGRAWVESTLGHGATFHFTWPLVEVRT